MKDDSASSARLPTYLPTYLPTNLITTYLPAYLPSYLLTYACYLYVYLIKRPILLKGPACFKNDDVYTLTAYADMLQIDRHPKSDDP